VLEPLDLMARLVALVAPPRMHLTRYHGVFAPHSKLRSAVTPAHRVTGLRIPRQKIAGLKTQRELGPDAPRVAIQSANMAEKSEKSRLAAPA